MRSERKKKPVTPDAARLRLADLCARSEQCESDLLRKLYLWGIERTESESIISDLYEGNFLNEKRFAKAFARDKVRFSGWGLRKIRLALIQKRISHEMIEDALEEIDPADIKDALRRSASAKARTLDLDDREGRASLYRHLLSRGFFPNEAMSEIRRLRGES